MTKFRLPSLFVDKYKKEDPNFGFNGLGELVFRRTYSRIKPDGTKEEWWEVILRVVNWTYSTQKRHILANGLPWDEEKATLSAMEMYDRMFAMKFLPPGRGLWIAGTEVLDRPDVSVSAALNNCAYVSTVPLNNDPGKPFRFMMDMSMLGIGVGFGTEGNGLIEVVKPSNFHAPIDRNPTYVVEDSREGWVKALSLMLNAFFLGQPLYNYDISQVRAKGEPIKGFGGTASGPKPLTDLLASLQGLLFDYIGKKLDSGSITDIMNLIGACVVAGNVRRTAQIAIGSHLDEQFLGLKDYKWDAESNKYIGKMAHRAAYGWTSNNSINAQIGMDYTKVAEQTALNGEPGYVWLQNMQDFGLMGKPADFKDSRAKGTNPCAEQTLESYELCCLVETFPTRNEDMQDYLRTLKFAYLYAKTVTLENTHWPETNQVMMRNRRIGTSMSGIAQFLEELGIQNLRKTCIQGVKVIDEYDEIYSDWLCVPKSIKKTSIKPSGTVSLLAGCTPGIHFPESTHYLRRFRLATNSEMVKPLMEAGYPIEPDMNDLKGTLVVTVPVELTNIRPVKKVSMWEQLSIAAFMQEHWADNQVSATINFDPVTEGPQIKHALNYFQYKLKGVSFLPHSEEGVYHQMPYEGITKEKYDEINDKIKPIKWSSKGEEAAGERFCSNDSCSI